MALGTGVNASTITGSALLKEAPGVSVSSITGSALLTWDALGVMASSVTGSALLVPAFLNPPVWDSALTFGPGFISNPYSQSGAWCTSGTSPITYTLNSGSLPTGLSLSSSGVNGTLSGTPTAIGSFTFTLKATNAFGSAVSQSFTITVTVPTGGSGGSSVMFVS